MCDLRLKNDLYRFIGTNNLELIKVLIPRECDVNVKLTYGETPLIHAVRMGKYPIVEYLLQQGADINLKHQGRTALDIAKSRTAEDARFQKFVDLINSYDPTYNQNRQPLVSDGGKRNIRKTRKYRLRRQKKHRKYHTRRAH